MSAAHSESRKRNKKRYAGGHHHSKRCKGARELEVGMNGILITCNMNEKKCTAEAFNLLNEYADQLYGPEKVTSLQSTDIFDIIICILCCSPFIRPTVSPAAIALTTLVVFCRSVDDRYNYRYWYRYNLYVLSLQLQEDGGSSSGEEEDVDVALKKEVAQLRASGPKQERRFQALDSGANNVIFIKTNSLGKLWTSDVCSGAIIIKYV